MHAGADLSEITCRLDRLEQQNRRLESQNHRLKLLAAAMVLVTGAVLVLGHPQATDAQGKKAAKAVEATKFVLLDAKGKQRAVLEMVDALDRPHFEFLDADGHELAAYKTTGMSITTAFKQTMASLGVDGLTIRGGDTKDSPVLFFDRGKLTVRNGKGKEFTAP